MAVRGDTRASKLLRRCDPRHFRGRMAVPPPFVRAAGLFLLGESQDVGHDGDLAVAARPARQDFDSIDKRTDGLDNLAGVLLHVAALAGVSQPFCDRAPEDLGGLQRFRVPATKERR
jgi:hypothetical protein